MRVKAVAVAPEKLAQRADVRTVGLIVTSCALYWLLGVRVSGLPLSAALFGLAAVTAARVTVRPRTWLDLILVSATLWVAWVLLSAEALSQAYLLGSPVAWVVAAGLWAGGWQLVGQAVHRSRPLSWPRRPASLGLGLPAWSAPWVVAFALQVAAAFILTWFAGINIFDSVSTYLPRSVRYLQNGSLNVYATHYDTTPYLHQVLVAYQLVFLRSDVLVNVLSFASALLTGLGVYTFARSLRWRGWLPLVAACLPFTMPVFLMAASSSNFDILAGLWMLLALYFLRRAAPTARPSWLLCAAVATGLALATKPTFWFAAPGLGLIWLVALARFLARRGPAVTARMTAWCAGVVLIVGAPYLIRNIVLHGTPLGRERMHDYVLGPSLSLVERLRLIAFNELALWTQLLTPPSLLGQIANEPTNRWFRSVATALGYTLPDPRWSYHPTWDDLLRHGIERYNLGHAFLGAGFVLVVVPSVVALAIRWRRLGPYRPVLGLCVLFALAYIAVLATLFRFDLHLGRYLIEPGVVLAVVSPAVFRVLPRPVVAVYVAVVGSVLLYEMRDVLLNNRQMPANSVTAVARSEQFYRYFGQAYPTLAAIHAFETKYPAEQYPEVYVDYRGAPNFPDYGFLGPSLTRRTTYWSPLEANPPIPPGVFLTTDADLVKRLTDRPEVLLDRLSFDTWAVVPVDRLRVVFGVRKATSPGPLLLDVRAAVPPALVQRPEYRFVMACGGTECVVRDFSPEPTALIPIDAPGVIRIEAREAGGAQPPQIQYIEPPRYLGI